MPCCGNVLSSAVPRPAWTCVRRLLPPRLAPPAHPPTHHRPSPPRPLPQTSCACSASPSPRSAPARSRRPPTRRAARCGPLSGGVHGMHFMRTGWGGTGAWMLLRAAAAAAAHAPQRGCVPHRGTPSRTRAASRHTQCSCLLLPTAPLNCLCTPALPLPADPHHPPQDG